MWILKVRYHPLSFITMSFFDLNNDVKTIISKQLIKTKALINDMMRALVLRVKGFGVRAGEFGT